MNAILNRLVQDTPEPVLTKRRSELLAHVGAPSTFDPKDGVDLLRYLVVDCGARAQQRRFFLSSFFHPLPFNSAEACATAGYGKASHKAPGEHKKTPPIEAVTCGRWFVRYVRHAKRHEIRFKLRADAFTQAVYAFEPQTMWAHTHVLFRDYRLSFNGNGSPETLGQLSESLTTVNLPFLCFQAPVTAYLPVKHASPLAAPGALPSSPCF